MDTKHTFWARIGLHDLRDADIEDIHTRVRGAGYDVDGSRKGQLMVDTGVQVSPRDLEVSIRMRGFRATSSVVRVATGLAQAFPLPALLKEATFTEDADVPRDFRPVSAFMTAAWHLERSLAHEMKRYPPAVTDIVELYFKRLSNVETEAFGALDDKAVVLKILCEHWDRGDVGCADILQKFLSNASYASLRIRDLEAAKIRTYTSLITQVSGTSTFLFGLHNRYSDQVTEDELGQATDFANGLVARSPRPRFLEDLVLSNNRSSSSDLWTHPSTDARAVELAVLEQHDGHPKDLVRLYLREISEVQKKHGVPDRGGHDTLQFVLDNWDLGDVGAGQKYAAHFEVSTVPVGTDQTRSITSRLKDLETRIQRRLGA